MKKTIMMFEVCAKSESFQMILGRMDQILILKSRFVTCRNSFSLLLLSSTLKNAYVGVCDVMYMGVVVMH